LTSSIKNIQYFINHVSAETLTIWLNIRYETNSPPAEVSTQWWEYRCRYLLYCTRHSKYKNIFPLKDRKFLDMLKYVFIFGMEDVW